MSVLTASLFFTFLQLSHCSLLRQNALYSTFDVIGKALAAIPTRTTPDWGIGIEELTHRYGYNIDTHEVTTEDGYILTLHHLSHNSKNISDSKRPVVFLMPGLAASSPIWVYWGPKSLGYALVNAGYDVWMGNARGTRYGRRHIKLNPNNDPKFWNFSFDELGYYDLPAMINYVLKETKMEKLIFIGHSQGNSAFFDMASRRPEYNKMIKVAVAASPIVFVTGLRYNIFLIFATIFIKLLGLKEIFRPGPLLPQLGRLLCSRERFNLCMLLYQITFGYSRLINPKMMPMIAYIFPDGISSKMLLHYHQIIKSDQFKRYDYGFIGNFFKYGHHSAPKIDISNVTAPVAMFYAPHDHFVPLRKVKKLEKILPNVQMMYEIKDNHFNHADFVAAENRDVLFHKPLISYLDSVMSAKH